MGFWSNARNRRPGDAAALWLEKAQAGDREAREELIRSYTPFIVKTASRACGRYLSQGEDDEVSIALLAFNEAVDSFRPAGGKSFEGFAETVIRRRLIDYFRREGNRPEVPFSGLEQHDDEGNPYNPAEALGAMAAHASQAESEERRDEIRRYAEALSRFGLSFAELVKLTPKHFDARLNAMRVARLVAGNLVYRDYLLETGNLPLRLLEEDPETGVSRKTLERQRKYIIAIGLIYIEELAYLKGYVQERGSSHGR